MEYFGHLRKLERGKYYGTKGVVGNFVVTRLSDILDKIIPFYQKYPVVGVKYLDFADFCKAAEIMKVKGHLTQEGLEQICKIKQNMKRVPPTKIIMMFFYLAEVCYKQFNLIGRVPLIKMGDFIFNVGELANMF